MTAKQTTAEEALECVAVCVQKTGWISEGDAATLRRVIEAARKVAQADRYRMGAAVANLHAALDGEP
jgi:hypothetical protein